MSGEPQIRRLSVEWRNIDAPDQLDGERMVSMQALKAKLLELKRTHTYRDIWLELAGREHERHAHSDEYVARLLYLVDERCVPVSLLQHTIGLQLGHIFRTFDRAGVVFRAHTSSISSRLRRGYWFWPCHVYLDPLDDSYLYEGVRYAIPKDFQLYLRDDDAEQWAEEDGDQEVRDEYLGQLELPDDFVPAPIYPALREIVTLPRYPEQAKVPAPEEMLKV